MDFWKLNNVDVLGMVLPKSQMFKAHSYDNFNMDINLSDLNKLRSYLGQEALVSNLISWDSIDKLNSLTSLSTIEPLWGKEQLFSSMINYYSFIAMNYEILENSKAGKTIRIKSKNGNVSEAVRIPNQG